MFAGYGRSMGILLVAMLIAMVGMVLLSGGYSEGNVTLSGIGIAFVLGGFGSFGYVAFYVRLVKFAMEDFYNLLVRIGYAKKYFLTFSVNDISDVVNDELVAAIKTAIPDFAEKFFKDYRIFLVHHQYTVEGDTVLIAQDSPRSISFPTPVEMLLGGWIVKTKVAELTGLELTHIVRPIQRQFTTAERIMKALFGVEPAGSKTVQFTKIPVVFVYDSDITPDLMKANLYGIPQWAKTPQQVQSVLEAVNKATVTTMTTPHDQEKKALQDHIGELNRIIQTEKLPFSFQTGEPSVTTPEQQKGDRIKTIVKVVTVAVVVLLGIWAFSVYGVGTGGVGGNNTYLPPGHSTTTTTVGYYNLTIVAQTGGTTQPAPGTYQYQPNSNVGLTAVANSGYNFYEWCATVSVTSTNCLSIYSAPSVNIQVNQNLVVIAVFHAVNATGG